MSRVDIDFFADLSCPWCYVGWASLKRAALARPNVSCRVQWRNFLLHPETPPDGIDRQAFFRDAYAPEQLAAIHKTLEAAAALAEAPLNLAAPTRLPNTINGHRLVRWAAAQGAAEAAIDALFAAYWVDGRDIGEDEVLVEIADAVGLDGDAVRALLLGDADRDEIAAMHNAATRIGVKGVPVAVLNRQAVLMGAESPDAYGMAIDKTAI